MVFINSFSVGDIINGIIALFTLFTLVIAYFTLRETKNQRIESMKPEVIIDFDTENKVIKFEDINNAIKNNFFSDQFKLKAINIKNAVAKNIKINCYIDNRIFVMSKFIKPIGKYLGYRISFHNIDQLITSINDKTEIIFLSKNDFNKNINTKVSFELLMIYIYEKVTFLKNSEQIVDIINDLPILHIDIKFKDILDNKYFVSYKLSPKINTIKFTDDKTKDTLDYILLNFRIL